MGDGGLRLQISLSESHLRRIVDLQRAESLTELVLCEECELVNIHVIGSSWVFVMLLDQLKVLFVDTPSKIILLWVVESK